MSVRVLKLMISLKRLNELVQDSLFSSDAPQDIRVAGHIVSGSNFLQGHFTKLVFVDGFESLNSQIQPMLRERTSNCVDELVEV